jgi:hypothetical protein
MLVSGQCQAAPAASSNNMKPADNSSSAIPLQATSTVGSCVTVEAVLLPREPAAKQFGGWVADHYAVVKTTVSNQCDDKQFILHDIYFDYSEWALSGLYQGLVPTALCSSPTAAGTASSTSASPDSSLAVPAPSFPIPSNDCSTSAQFARGSQPGQVATVGALDVQDQLTEASVFSSRNLIVNGLVLVGTVAGGYAFIGSTAWTQGIGTYNSVFIPGLQKFWPDRRIDQEKNVLSFGYRTDQSNAIAKDDHGSYYAFFPLSVFLMPNLKALFLSNPAAFINPAEVLLDINGESAKPSKSKKASAESLRNFLLDLAATISGGTQTLGGDEAARRRQSMKLLVDLTAPCNLTKNPTGEWDAGEQCPYDPKDSAQLIVLKQIKAEKLLFAHASLNVVKIVAKGVMTVNVDNIPPTIDTVTFDGTADQAYYWTVTQPKATNPAPTTGAATDANANVAAAPGGKGAKGVRKESSNATAANAQVATPATPATAAAPAATASASNSGDCASTPTADKLAPTPKDLTGVIAGKYLTGGTPAVAAITVPADAKATPDCYIVLKSMQAVTAKSTDTSMAFRLQLSKMLPSGSKLTFQVSHSAGNSSTGTSSQTTSNKYDYIVTYAGSATPAAEPVLANVKMDDDDKTDVWQIPGKLNGTATGTDLDGATIKVSALKIAGKAATVSEYIGTLVEVPKSSSAISLDFQLPLLKKIDDGSTVSFEVGKTVAGVTQSEAFGYIVKNPAASVKKAVPPAKKPAPKSAKSGAPANR